jgi:hypothetical protein
MIKYTITIETVYPRLHDSQKSLIELINHLVNELQVLDDELSERQAIETLCLLVDQLDCKIKDPDNSGVNDYIERVKAQFPRI